MKDTKYRWIAYYHHPLGGFEVERHTNLYTAGRGLVDYCENTGFYYDLQVNGEYGCTASLYPFTEEDWAEAKEYEEIGCPFDYPSKLLKRGPRGGVSVINA